MAGFEDKWSEFLSDFKDGVGALAQNVFESTISEARDDAQQFIEDSEQAFRRWSVALLEGRITKGDFEYLVVGQQSLARMRALQALGLSQVRIERFRKGLLNLVVNSIFKSFGV